jgi:pilus assembly protein CpaE
VILRLTIGGFSLGPELSQTLEQLRQDPLFSRSKFEVGGDGLAGAIEHYRAKSTPQVLIVEELADEAVMRSRLEQLSDVCVAGTQVIVVGRINDIAAYRRLLSLGISDYLVGPVSPAQIAASIETLFADPQASPKGRLIAFIGSRGGAGSSTLAHNTAWMLSRSAGEEVIVADLDLAFGTLGLAFNADARQTVGELLNEPERIDAQLIDRMLIRADDRLQLLPSPGMSGVWLPIEIETVDNLLELLRRMASQVVIDLPHLWAPWVAHVLELADAAVIVSPPDLPGLRDAKALLDNLALRRTAKQTAHLVINKADLLRKSQLSTKDFEESLKHKPAMKIAFDPMFGEALNEGQMIERTARNHKLVDQLTALAQLVAPRHHQPPKRNRIDLSALAGWMKKKR